jgi:ubiquinone/menaquinone biosynthesis C-methylase UbiE
MNNESSRIKAEILDNYYRNVYQSYLFGGGAQAKGIEYFEKSLEKFWVISTPNSVLELGGGSGEHFQYIKYVPSVRYDLLDLKTPYTDVFLNEISDDFRKKINLVKGDAQKLPYESEVFDRIFSTCILHHVDDVLSVLLETRRVAQRNAEIVFAMPTDPGLLNRFVKNLFSYRRIRKYSDIKPQLIYSLEHKNHVPGILELIKFVFSEDNVRIKYRPFPFLRSWNLNLFVVVKITKS